MPHVSLGRQSTSRLNSHAPLSGPLRMRRNAPSVVVSWSRNLASTWAQSMPTTARLCCWRAFILVYPLWFFRYARSIWLHVYCSETRRLWTVR